MVIQKKGITSCRALRILATALFLLIESMAANAYDFWAANKGVTIYYKIISSLNKTCGVTYESTNYNSYPGTVVIPETVTSSGITYTVTSIGDSAFKGCTGLTSVTIPESVTEIGSSAFFNCTGVTSMTIPENVTSIGNSAFFNCTGVTSMTIPENVTSIGNSAFEGCTGLTQVNFNATACTTAGSSQGSAFSGCLADIIFGDNVTIIPSHLFYKFSWLTKATIPSSVKEIGSYAFYNCTGLTGGLTIGNGVTSIGGYAFHRCTGLKEVIIDGGAIGDYAFYNCSGLTSLAIGESVTEIGSYAFENCSGLTSLAIGESVTEIGSYAFENCSGLTTVTIPSGVTSLYWDAFRGCTSLKSLTFEDGGNTLNVGSSENYYSSPSFSYLESLYLGRDLSYSNSDSSNKGCYSPFATTTTLSSVTIGEKVSQLPDYLFYNCTGLVSVNIGNGVTSIGDSAFYNCKAMRKLSIGSRVATIGNSAFDSCRRLESLTSLNTTPPTCSASGNGVFYNVPVKTCTLYVTEGSKDAYASAYAWEDFLTIIDNQVDAIEGITTNGNAEAVGYYTLDGKQVPTPQRGINIIRYSDGTVKKVLVK